MPWKKKKLEFGVTEFCVFHDSAGQSPFKEEEEEEETRNI